MKNYDLVAITAITLVFSGCSRDYDVNFPFDKTNVVGTWVLKSAPDAAFKTLGTNGHAPMVIFKSDGSAEYNTFPVQTVFDLNTIRSMPSQWKVVSGTNIWLFGNERYGSQNVWEVTLETDERGLELDVGRLRSGEYILIYKPDANSDDAPVIFMRTK